QVEIDPEPGTDEHRKPDDPVFAFAVERCGEAQAHSLPEVADDIATRHAPDVLERAPRPAQADPPPVHRPTPPLRAIRGPAAGLFCMPARPMLLGLSPETNANAPLRASRIT